MHVLEREGKGGRVEEWEGEGEGRGGGEERGEEGGGGEGEGRGRREDMQRGERPISASPPRSSCCQHGLRKSRGKPHTHPTPQIKL